MKCGHRKTVAGLIPWLEAFQECPCSQCLVCDVCACACVCVRERLFVSLCGLEINKLVTRCQNNTKLLVQLAVLFIYFFCFTGQAMLEKKSVHIVYRQYMIHKKGIYIVLNALLHILLT